MSMEKQGNGFTSGYECSPVAPGIIQTAQCTMAFLRIAVGDLVTSCLIIHVLLLNLQVHTWGMSLASSGKFV